MAAPGGRRAYRWARIIGIVAAFLLLADCGILGDLRLAPGFAAFGSPGVHDTDLDLPVSLGPVSLGLARLFVHDSRGLSALLGNVSAVRVYVYDVNGDVAHVRERIEAVRDRLVRLGWQPLVAIREDDDWVLALVKLDGGTIAGAAVVVQDRDQLVLANLIGRVRPETVGALIADLCGPASRRASAFRLDEHLRAIAGGCRAPLS